MVSGAINESLIWGEAHLLTIGLTHYRNFERYEIDIDLYMSQTSEANTEREVRVSAGCPTGYGTFAADLSRQLGRADHPPPVVDNRNRSNWEQSVLIETTSGRPVALRAVVTHDFRAADGASWASVALLLPRVSNLSAWFGAFLSDIHETDPASVPQSPPRLSNPSDWHTPEERTLAERIETITNEVERLDDERDRLNIELAVEGETADAGIRRAVWADGDGLVAAVSDILTLLGFTVHDMDAGLKQGEPKREDLRLTQVDRPDWEAIVEVKGYSSGTRTNDARQIREHRDRYLAEKGRAPDLTLWLANPHRAMDPSSRPAPDGNVRSTADNVGAVHVLASDLYKQWSLVANGRLEADDVVQCLVIADPGLWIPPAYDSDKQSP